MVVCEIDSDRSTVRATEQLTLDRCRRRGSITTT